MSDSLRRNGKRFTPAETKFIEIYCNQYNADPTFSTDAAEIAYKTETREQASKTAYQLLKRQRVIDEIDRRMGRVTDLSISEGFAQELLRRARDPNETATMRQKYLVEYGETMGFRRKSESDRDPANQVQQQNIDGSDRSLMATLRERLMLSATGKLTQQDTAKTNAKQGIIASAGGGGMPSGEGVGDDKVPR